MREGRGEGREGRERERGKGEGREGRGERGKGEGREGGGRERGKGEGGKGESSFPLQEDPKVGHSLTHSKKPLCSKGCEGCWVVTSALIWMC